MVIRPKFDYVIASVNEAIQRGCYFWIAALPLVARNDKRGEMTGLEGTCDDEEGKTNSII